MKLVTYDAGTGGRVGVLDGERILDAGFDGDMVAFIEAGAPVTDGAPVDGARLLAPLRPRTLRDFLVIKVGTGIGCGIVCQGQVYRGATGSAGDVGHICVDPAGPRCHCGNLGCVEAMAAGPAIARMARAAVEAGESALLAETLAATGTIRPEDVARASRAGDTAANAIVQRAGGLIGQMLASVVNFFNPSHVFFGGSMMRIGPLFLASLRQSIYQRSLALSTRQLEIQVTPLGEQSGLIGAAVLAMQETLRMKGASR